ncbi:MAG: type 2 isopentenyl-diphosphate Delta-isomerase [Elusimicrobia bacterium]|nr:type 2 isopentenyl-diphosphate Delta-isomerase [Elusimicrobiota bacterium]
MIGSRKLDHLKICREMDVEYRDKTTLLEDVQLVHQALAGLSFDDIRTETIFMGRKLKAPILITAMSGGVSEAGSLNLDLARAAQALGIGFCLGSQRPMLEDAAASSSYQVRAAAPDIPIVGNIGIQQAAQSDPDKVARLVSAVEADGLAVHLNPAQELSQPEGDRVFPEPAAVLKALSRRLPGRLLVKETGCGISREAALKIRAAGVRVVDVAGAGGTSWPWVEKLRKGAKPQKRAWLDEWGISTGASVLETRGLGLQVVASGGVRNGLDAAKCLALGADLVGMALPVLRSHAAGGCEGVVAFLSGVITELKTAMLLCGARDLKTLAGTEPVITGKLSEWKNLRRKKSRIRR